MDNIKIVRLQSGEDIIADYKENDGEGTVLLNNPMTLMFKRLPTGKAFMLMAPWLPVELIESNATFVYATDILAVMQPKVSLIEYYHNSINELELEMLESGKEIEEALLDFDSSYTMSGTDGEEEEEVLDEEEQEIRESLEELRRDIKKKLLH